MKGNKKVAWLVVMVLAVLPAAVALAAKTPVFVNGTAWNLTAKVQLKVKKLGGFKDVDSLTLYFGPNIDQSLADNEFKVKDNSTGDSYTGTWADPKANGKVVFNGNAVDIESALADVITQALENVYTTVSDVNVSVTKMKLKGSVKPGKGVKVALKAAFGVSATVDGTTAQSKGSFAIKGKGDALR